jgi:hypothetical protein
VYKSINTEATEESGTEFACGALPFNSTLHLPIFLLPALTLGVLQKQSLKQAFKNE